MTVKEQIAMELGNLSESDLREMAQYLAYLKFRDRSRKKTIPIETELKALYAEAGDEDVNLAEAGLADYAQGLAQEDTK